MTVELIKLDNYIFILCKVEVALNSLLLSILIPTGGRDLLFTQSVHKFAHPTQFMHRTLFNSSYTVPT